jgi:hypothetical protein
LDGQKRGTTKTTRNDYFDDCADLGGRQTC